jgi:hypothetical protein
VLASQVANEPPPQLVPAPDNHASTGWSSFVTRCLTKDAKDRPSAAVLQSDRWLSGSANPDDSPRLVAAKLALAQVRKTPSWPRSWANFSLFLAVLPQECMGQLASFGPT